MNKDELPPWHIKRQRAYRISRVVMVIQIIAALLLSAVILFGINSLTGCYRFAATTLPSHIRTVRIAEVDYNKFDPVLGNRLRDGIVDLFKTNAPAIRVVNENADADFSISLLGYTNLPEAHSSDAKVETYRVTLRVSVNFHDNVTKKDIYDTKSVQAYGSYDVQKNESEERHGQERAIEKLQEIIIVNALAKW